MARPSLVARCRLLLAQIAVRQRRAEEALAMLEQIPPDDEGRTIGPELRAELHYLRSVSLAAAGNRDGAKTELATARRFVEGMAAALAEKERSSFSTRADIRRIVG